MYVGGIQVISNQESLNLSPFMALYDIVVRKDNMLRKINELVDFSFILEELKTKYCLDNGHNAISPIRMFRYLLLKSINDLSDVGVVECSKSDMSFKYFFDMAPEDSVIDPSSLIKFRKLRLGKTVEIALEKEILKSKTIIVDAWGRFPCCPCFSHTSYNFLHLKQKIRGNTQNPCCLSLGESFNFLYFS